MQIIAFPSENIMRCSTYAKLQYNRILPNPLSESWMRTWNWNKCSGSNLKISSFTINYWLTFFIKQHFLLKQKKNKKSVRSLQISPRSNHKLLQSYVHSNAENETSLPLSWRCTQQKRKSSKFQIIILKKRFMEKRNFVFSTHWLLAGLKVT